jgi:hypothetical protein
MIDLRGKKSILIAERMLRARHFLVLAVSFVLAADFRIVASSGGGLSFILDLSWTHVQAHLKDELRRSAVAAAG